MSVIPRGRTSVLLAVSHGGLNEGLRGLLATLFDSVVMVADERSLSGCAESLRPDLAVVDIQLGGSGDGPRLVALLHALLPQTKVLAFGGNDPALARAALAAGADDYLLKSALGSELLPAAERLLAARPDPGAGDGNGSRAPGGDRSTGGGRPV